MRKRVLNFKEVGDRVVLYPENYINDIEGEKLEELCVGFLEKGINKIVMDFSNTELINSVGISILIGIMERVRGEGGVLLYSGLKRVNRDICEMVGLTKHVQVFNTEKEALEGFSVKEGPAC
jgi:stage II sporulation protein AA (anti-sigma F factor antagonist)